MWRGVPTSNNPFPPPTFNDRGVLTGCNGSRGPNEGLPGLPSYCSYYSLPQGVLGERELNTTQQYSNCADSASKKWRCSFSVLWISNPQRKKDRYVNYTMDFPFKWMGRGIKLDFDVESATQFVVQTYPYGVLVLSALTQIPRRCFINMHRSVYYKWLA